MDEFMEKKHAHGKRFQKACTIKCRFEINQFRRFLWEKRPLGEKRRKKLRKKLKKYKKQMNEERVNVEGKLNSHFHLKTNRIRIRL